MQFSTLLFLAASVVVVAAHSHELFKHLNQHQREELKAILNDDNATRAEIHQSVAEWVKKQSEDVQKAYKEDEKQLDEEHKKLKEEQKKKVASASAASKAVAKEISAVLENNDLTAKNSCQKVNQIIEKASEDVKNELNLTPQDCSGPFHHHPPPPPPPPPPPHEGSEEPHSSGEHHGKEKHHGSEEYHSSGAHPPNESPTV